MTVEELLKPRYEVTADYPHNVQRIGHIIEFIGNEEGVSFSCDHYSKYPNLFRKMHWSEKRLLDDLMSIRYVKITIYTGYWVVGDIVRVTDYVIDTQNKKLIKFILDGTQSSIPERCVPATEQEYQSYINSK